VHVEFVAPGQAVKGKYIVEFWGYWGQNIRYKPPENWRNGSSVQYLYKATAHSSHVVQLFLAVTNTTVITHLPSSPDHALCDVFLFSKMKFKLKGRRFDSIIEIQTVWQNVMRTLMQNELQKCFWSWKSY
jgi:hypothetical protein